MGDGHSLPEYRLQMEDLPTVEIIIHKKKVIPVLVSNEKQGIKGTLSDIQPHKLQKKGVANLENYFRF